VRQGMQKEDGAKIFKDLPSIFFLVKMLDVLVRAGFGFYIVIVCQKKSHMSIGR
jgi:hypothetical protein